MQDNHTLLVRVHDQRNPPRLAHALVHVVVNDVNDNAPIFLGQPYYVSLPIKPEPGKLPKVQVKPIFFCIHLYILEKNMERVTFLSIMFHDQGLPGL